MDSSVFAVKYTEFVIEKKGDKRRASSTETANVAADDAEKAIAKLRKERIGDSWDWTDDTTGNKNIAKVVRVDILGVQHVCDIEYA